MKKKHALVSSSVKKKRKRSYSSNSQHVSDLNTLFALLLASLSNQSQTTLPFITKCLSKIHHSLLLSKSSLTPILALLPSLLSSTHSQIVRRAADIIGAASLVSLKINQEIATDSQTVKGLISLFNNPNRKVQFSACNAVLDLSTTAVAQQQLLNFSALHKLMFVFLQIFKHVESVCFWSEGNESFHSLKIGIREDELSVALLSAIIVLLNACDLEQLHDIPTSLSEASLNLLKVIRANASHHLVTRGAMKSNEEGHLCKSNIGVSDLAESIFRLSINSSQLTNSLPLEVVQRGLFDSDCIKEPLYLTTEDVLKCEQAYKEGYTLALRGLEFRYQSIAAIADTLALMFGQPSVGANLYLTPPNSQGLACHFDDHCVFVCQIFGSKKWTVFSRPSQMLPRLYDSLCGSVIDCSKTGRREFFLKEGDVLYIPRGFPHEAYTNYSVESVDDGSPGFSLHLTLSIEVEPPFE
ncbi:hypothetical protein TSUD_205640 [Trifolium subterraneum]|uniref:Bifunctional lysine-specific demethylase and histidyl-hydroxylase n=1 Tax=Trifolium subterraneum TaxID=3900 RepID=A0A2Z6NEH1_TRISU|nr:hypothetical protein TSUD_205640 [Trifolium subterraneum]